MKDPSNHFCVNILNPDDTIKHKLYFKQPHHHSDNHPDDYQKVMGGLEDEDDEFDFSNIDETVLQITENKIELKNLKPENYFNTVVYPEDSIWTLRQKIYLCTGIPIYRQHVFFYQGEIHKTGYSIIIQGSDYPISRKKDTKKVLDLMVDLTIYASRDTLQIRTEETYTTLDDHTDVNHSDANHYDYNMYDLTDYIGHLDHQQLLNDNYQFMVIYYSVIKKYFPVLDEQMFRQYLQDEDSLISIYPLLNVSKKYLEDRFALENKILSDVYTHFTKYEKKFMPDILTEIISIDINCIGTGSKLMIRNLIDLIKMSNTYIAIDAYITNQSKYRIIKYWLGLEPYILQQVLDADEDYFGKEFIVLYIFDGTETHNLYIYDDSSYKFVGMYPHTHDITLDNIIDRTKGLVQPIIDLINTNTQYLFSKVLKYIPQNLEFNKIHTKLKWAQSYNDTQFNKFPEVLGQYYSAGILSKRAVNPRPNTYMTKIVKGMTRQPVHFYLKKGVETKDYYIIFKDNKIHETWNNRYGGENLEITNTLVNVIFELHGMTVSKYNRSVKYVLQLINSLNEHISVDEKRKIVVKTGKKKKFKDIDPELYDFEDDKGTKYARICQKQHRPVDILTEKQYEELEEKDKKYIFPFINYTTGEPVYYKCHEKLPYAGFIVNKHPKGYCVPKCKKSDTNGIKNKQIWSLCMEKRKVDKDELITKTHNDNILKFGKVIDVDKYGYIHDTLITVLDVDKEEFLITGYESFFDSVNGGQILDILAYQLNIAPVNIIDKILENLTQDIWNSLLSTNTQYEDFIILLGKFRTNSAVNQLNWTDTFIELINIIFGIHIIIFDTTVLKTAEMLNKNNSSISIKYTDLCKFSVLSDSVIEMCLIVHLYDQFYPVNLITNTTIKIFNNETKVNKKLCKIIKKLESFDVSQYATFEYKKLSKLTKIVAKYIWQRKIHYVECEKGEIIGCYNSISHTDGIEERYSLIDQTKIKSEFADVAVLLENLTREVPIFICFNEHLQNVNTCEDCQIVGCRIGPIFCWFKAVTCADIRKIYPKFGIELMNFDVYKINNAIIKNAKPENKHLEGINVTYYNMYIYKIFKFEFYKLLMLYKKSQKMILDKYKSNELAGFIQAKKSSYPFSYYKLQNVLKYSEYPEEDIKNMVVFEDIFTLRESLIELSVTKIKGLVSKYITKITSIQDIPIENIIYSPIIFNKLTVNSDMTFEYDISSISDDESLFYKGGKLKVLNIDSMVQLLIKDIKNDLLFQYEITNFQLMFVINYLNFRNYSDEKIIIQSL